MSDKDPLVEEFFSEVNDKYYPQVFEGLELLDKGSLEEGIEILSRPLHTIKGVTGFMGGFEFASGFTHKVEDFLKKVQSGAVEPSTTNIGLLTEAVNMIFQVIEQLYETGTPDENETDEMLARIKAVDAPGDGQDNGGSTAGVVVEEKNGATIIHVKDRRVHFDEQRKATVDAIVSAGPGSKILLDFQDVLTFNSASWEGIAALAELFDISVTNMAPACKEVFYSWGFDKHVKAAETEETYFSTMQ